MLLYLKKGITMKQEKYEQKIKKKYGVTKEELKDATYTYSDGRRDYSKSFLVCGL